VPQAATAVVSDLAEILQISTRHLPNCKFSGKIYISDNSIHKVFKRHAVIGINRIYSMYGNIHSVPELRHVIDELFTHSHSFGICSGYYSYVITLLLLDITLHILSETMNGCYLHMCSSFFFVAFVFAVAFLANKRCLYIALLCHRKSRSTVKKYGCRLSPRPRDVDLRPNSHTQPWSAV